MHIASSEPPDTTGLNHSPKLVVALSLSLSTSLPSPFLDPASAPPIHDISSLCIADTGCTGHYIHITTPHFDRTIANPSISVLLPDGSTIHSTHTATLDLPLLPPAARFAHIFPTLSSGSLLSIGLLCDHGCTATFNPHSVDITLDGATILTGTRSPTTNLWTIDLSAHQPPARPIFLSHHQPSHSINALLANDATIARRVAFYHAALFSPSLSTWCSALDAGHLTTWPDLTSAQVRRHPPPSIPMIKGHLDQQRANLQSTKRHSDKHANNATAILHPSNTNADTDKTDTTISPIPSTVLVNTDDFHPPPTTPPALRTHLVYADFASATGQIFTDLTGRFIQPSSKGNSDMLVIYDFDSNYIHVEAMRSKSGPEILAAYTRAHTLLTSRGLKPQLQRLDNEASTALKSFMTNHEVDFQLVPPHVHRRNAAERAIRTFKNHFIAGLCSTDRNFPLHLWDRLLPQALLSLNLLRSSRINPKLSAWAQVHGAFDFNRTPLAPPGTRVLIHEPSTVRDTWAPHAVEGWYLGPAPLHYRCYTIWADATSAERIANTLTWFPSHVEMPATSSLELATAAAQDLVAALLNSNDAAPLPPAALVQRAALQQLADIFATITDTTPSPQTSIPPLSSAPHPPAGHVPRVEALPSPPVLLQPLTTTITPPSPQQSPTTCTSPTALSDDVATYHSKTRNPGQRRRQAKRAAKLATTLERTTNTVPPAPLSFPIPTPHSHVTRSSTGHLPRANCVVATSALPLDPQLLIVDDPSAHFANAVIDPATGASLEYPALLRGPDAAKWEHGTSLELGRLTKGCLPYTTSGSETMVFIRHTDKPHDRVATYLRIVAALKPNKADMYRIRFTCGGDKIIYAGKVSTPTADLTTVKTHLNSVVSTPDAKYMTIDIKDFYLGTPMAQFEYMWIPVKFIPSNIMDQYNLAPLVHNNMVMVEIRMGMYGLPQAGILANTRLQTHLAQHGYVAAKHTPGFFTHTKRPISFTLVVDDFGVKYVGKHHAQHLIDTLQLLYTVTIDWTGTLYCGLTLAWNYKLRYVDISMPGYVSRALHKFLHTPAIRAQHSPHAWIPPTYGATVQYAPDDDTSPSLDASALKNLQNVIGTFLYYARAVDSTMLVALGSLASAQTNGTAATTIAVTQLLNYCATHPDAVLRFHGSGMILHVHSDASYLSEKKARSRAGGIFFLSSPLPDPSCAPTPDSSPPPSNGAIHVHSSIMTSVLSSATEAELGALFHNGKEAAMLRTTLADMGHPQPATPIQTDNACASGICNDTVKQRRSKAMDMRFYWIRDRVQQGHFFRTLAKRYR
ncbi:hypothetical protein MHU86_24250 [Fragilaria crotonensis]|nr:hypothetical protein MHU86_24250 [Fragilaria crotonensis]